MKKRFPHFDEQLANSSVVSWSRKTATHVPVLCGSCQVERWVTINKIIYSDFTGLCRTCGNAKRRDDELLGSGSLIGWSRRADPRVPVVCGGCGQERLLEITGVTRTDFTGLCHNCANYTSIHDETLEDGSIVFWSERKGYRVRIQCGQCGKVRIVHANSIRRAASGYCNRCAKLGERAGNWRGGRVKRDGYVEVRINPSHPFYQIMAQANGYVREHRLVMAEHLGRPLEKTEVVHHKNGDKTDNRIENLELYVSFQEHGRKLQERMPHPGHMPAHKFNQLLALVKKMLRDGET